MGREEAEVALQRVAQMGLNSTRKPLTASRGRRAGTRWVGGREPVRAARPGPIGPAGVGQPAGPAG